MISVTLELCEILINTGLLLARHVATVIDSATRHRTDASRSLFKCKSCLIKVITLRSDPTFKVKVKTQGTDS